MKKFCIPFFLAILCLIPLTACGQKDKEPLQKTNFVLDTVATISLYDWEDPNTLELAFDAITRLENLLSVEKEGSDLYRLAKSAGKNWVDIAPETQEVLEKAKEYYKLSGGLLDVTTGPLINLWDIHNGEGHYPSQEELDAVLPLINCDDLLVEDGRAFLKREGMEANLGAIAKGYIADKVKELLIAEGVQHAVIDLGRNILLVGGKTEDTKFVIGIQDPNEEEGIIDTRVSASDLSIVTSGINERFFTYNGKEYHHVLDPHTGFPVDNDLASVTILSRQSVDGDALSTTCLLKGLDEGLALIESLPDTEAFFISKDGTTTASSGFGLYVTEE